MICPSRLASLCIHFRVLQSVFPGFVGFQYVQCPHETCRITVEAPDFGCQIFRCAWVKGTQVNPHAPQSEVAAARLMGGFAGCGRPFRFDGRRTAKIPWHCGTDRYTTEISDYDIARGVELYKSHPSPQNWVLPTTCPAIVSPSPRFLPDASLSRSLPCAMLLHAAVGHLSPSRWVLAGGHCRCTRWRTIYVTNPMRYL